MKFQLIFLSTILFLLHQAKSQNPYSIKWKQIKTQHFKIVYSTELDTQAYYAAHLLEKAYAPTSQMLDVSPKPIKLYLFNQTVDPNGYAALGPRRMTWFSTPSQDATQIGGSDWFQALAIHEFRHVSQFAKLDSNIIDLAGTLFGDYGNSFVMNIFIPAWFYEGDAIYAETALSNNGRGRMPSFYRDIASLEASNIRYSYSKAYLGSYRHYFPNWYHLGFIMTNHVISNYDRTCWSDAIAKTSANLNFSRSLKKFTGFNTKHTYRNALDEFKNDSYLLTKENIEPFDPINSKNKIYTQYKYPFSIGNDSVIAYKKGFNNSGEIVLFHKNTETELFKINPSDRIHSNGKLIVWATTTPDIRWTEQSFSDIVVYNIAKSEKTRISKNEKLFAPAISPSGNKIAAIEYNSKMECSLVILDAKSGEKYEKFKMPLGTFLRFPSWNADENKIVVTANTGQINKLVIIELDSKKISTLKSFDNENVSSAIFYENYIIYNSPISGTDNIFALDTNSLSTYLVVNAKFGAYNPSINFSNNSLLFQDYQRGGFNIASIPLANINWQLVDTKNLAENNGLISFLRMEKTENLFENFTMDSVSTTIPSKKYSPFLNSINIHSWAPYPKSGGIGFNLFADDELYTTHARFGGEYFPKDKANRIFAELTYAALFPEFSFNYSNGRKYFYDEDNTNQKAIDENVFGLQVNVPLNLSRNNYDNLLNITTGFDKIYQKQYNDTTTNFTTFELSLVNLGIDGSFIKQKAYRDLLPKFGVEVTSNYYTSINTETVFKNRSTSKLTMYLPAPLNHGFKLSGGIETNKTEENTLFIYQLPTDLEMVYGYNKANFTPDFYANGLVAYSMPLFYPDMAIGSLIYCKRVHTNVFYNAGLFKYKGSQTNLNSIGIEFQGEFNFFNILLPVEIGVRISNRLYDNTMAYEFMFLGTVF